MDALDRRIAGEYAEEPQTPEDMVTAAFSRCPNWPKERAGVIGLAQGLVRASERQGVAMAAIVAACVEVSTFCPTDTDLMNVARSLKPQANQSARKCSEGLCDGTGWLEVYTLHTHRSRPGGAAWVERVDIGREQYDSLSKQIDWVTQMVYSARRRCICNPASDDRRASYGKYA